MTGYLIRPGRIADAADLARLQAEVQLQTLTGGQPHPGIAAWTEDLLDGHPTVTPDNFLVAEHEATGRPVASLAALRQEWSLAGVRLPIVQIELVGTAPEHRGNRLTERLFAALHQTCDTSGVPLQMIEGIPYFYRRLGYDYALVADGAATLPMPVPAGPAGELMMRPATAADADTLAAVDRRLADGDTLFCPRDATVWRYEITGRRPADIARREVAVLLRGSVVRGYLVHGGRPSATGELIVVAAACDVHADWPHAANSMYAYLGELCRHHEASAMRPLLGPDHPLVRFGPPGVPRRPRSWYLRTGDPAGLLARLRPLLHARWQAAGMRWPAPTITIDSYGRAARLEFTDGELTSVTATRGAVNPSMDPATHAAIPPGALLQLALGHRTVSEVLDIWPDCVLRDRLTEQFLTAAFPRMPVRVWPRT
ncbi:GNAT family N-acetyltransferase [Actinoplanes sp. NBRC 103695]|uniref:GNAT family N-acetyltransferase n=1 Tax=Actinoplanes sp. NBRC 103695 TaxID=3032202 RepID=UPI0024A5A739|nr:GNAT family N-acetyltransferase [Actinoplanes sp. NBRC 103695]GLZ02079.1 hypothetical protein Acsp02_93300 [Actinoplanes sp. NBRC 103695]